MLSDLIQLLVGGILLGGIYGLAAFGLSITFGVLNVLNLAHGEFLMLGSLMSYALFTSFGISPFLAAILVIPVFMILGGGFYLFLLKPINPRTSVRETKGINNSILNSLKKVFHSDSSDMSFRKKGCWGRSAI